MVLVIVVITGIIFGVMTGRHTSGLSVQNNVVPKDGTTLVLGSKAMYYVNLVTQTMKKNYPLLLVGLLVVFFVVALVLVLRQPAEADQVIDDIDAKKKKNFLNFGIEVYVALAVLVIGVIAVFAYYFSSDPKVDYAAELRKFTWNDGPLNLLTPDNAGPTAKSEKDLENDRKDKQPKNAEIHDQAFSDKKIPIESGKFVLAQSEIIDTTPTKNVSLSADVKSSLKDRFLGAMVGLAMCDAYGSAYEFMSPQTVAKMKPGNDHKHPGVYSKRLGAWTDDTSMALCLLASAVELGKFDVEDVFKRYKAWLNTEMGNNLSIRYMNFDPTKEDAGPTTQAAVRENKINVKSQPSWGNGVIMRLAPVALQYLFTEDKKAMRIAAASGGMTAGDQSALDFTAALAYIIRGFIKGTLTKMQVCDAHFVPTHLGWYFEKYPYGEFFKATKDDWQMPRPLTRGQEQFSSHVVFSWALFSFCTTESFMDGLKRVVAFGYDTDTSAAVYGQISGAYYGLNNVAQRKNAAGTKNADGIAASKLYQSTQRIDAIRMLTDLLWCRLINDNQRDAELSQTLIIDGMVRDLNPKYQIGGVRDVLNNGVNMSTTPSVKPVLPS